MNFQEYKYLVLSDLYRIKENISFFSLSKEILFGTLYKYNFWMRTCRFTRQRPLLKFTIYPFASFMLKRYIFKYLISIPFSTKIGSGFFISHFGCIVVNEKSVIGKNCNIAQGVTIGQVNRGKYKGFPVLGDNVYIGPGAKILGSITIGDNVAIGANCVVTKDVPDNGVVVGVPSKVISYDGSIGYVNRIDYDDLLKL